MTTDDYGAETTETDGTPKHARATRSIDVLLCLDTYQGMTDAEIQSLIDWHAERARNDETLLAEFARIDVVGMAAVNAYRKVAEDSAQLLQSKLEEQGTLRRVSYDGA